MRGIYILTILILSFAVSCEEAVLPSINIEKEGTIGWDEKEPCNIVYTTTEIEEVLPGRIKCRGGSSSKYYKHSFSLELEEKFSFVNLPRDDDWILNASYIDKTFMRHKISYDLFREMNEKNIAPGSSFVNVSVNGEYRGLYVLMEEVNGAMVGLNKSDTMAMLFKDPLIFRKEGLKHVQDSLNPHQQKYPKIDESDKTEYIERFKDFLFNSDDRDFARDISNWVDIENVIDWHLLLLFSNSGDGVLKNFYLYKIDCNTPFRFAIWDYDHTFGRDGDNELNLMDRDLNWERSILLERLFNISDIGYVPKIKNRWSELRGQNILSVENFEAHILKNDRIIREEVRGNFEKWPLDDSWYYDSNDYTQELDLMRDFVKLRVNQLDAYFDSL